MQNIKRKWRYICDQKPLSQSDLSLLRAFLLTVYKSLTRSHLDYRDVIYDQSSNNSKLSDKIESLQYNASLAVTVTIRETSNF